MQIQHQEGICINHIQKTFEDDFVSDFLIIGGGPAGATAAYHIAKAGKSVILLDRQCFPRDKVCGDFVNQIALAEHEKMGITKIPEFEETNCIDSTAIFVDKKEYALAAPLFFGFSGSGRVIPRKSLDHWILDVAKKAGASVLENFLVTDFVVENNQVRVIALDKEGKNHIFHARLLIGADGNSSLISRKIHADSPAKPNHIMGFRGYFEDVKGPASHAEVHFLSNPVSGYCWFFPVDQNKANVGIIALLEGIPKEETFKEKWDQLIEQNFKQRLGKTKLKSPIQSGPINVYDPHREIIAERVMLVGEAAGLVNPINGEGIQYALQSGAWAAETALKCQEKDNYSQIILSEYTEKVQKELEFSLKLSALLIQFVRNRNLNPLWLRTMEVILPHNNPEQAKLTDKILSGTTPHIEELKPKILLNMMKSAATTTTQKVINNPSKIPKEAVKFAKISLKAAKSTAQNPVNFLEWSIETSLKAAEVAVTIPRHLLKEHAKKQDSNSL
jgi:geranylgeranyl reductase family protein